MQTLWGLVAGKDGRALVQLLVLIEPCILAFVLLDQLASGYLACFACMRQSCIFDCACCMTLLPGVFVSTPCPLRTCTPLPVLDSHVMQAMVMSQRQLWPSPQAKPMGGLPPVSSGTPLRPPLSPLQPSQCLWRSLLAQRLSR